ncbi:MAG: GTP-binding protein [Synergistaceae bacterium]|nr:GTP-binding protein [Synergistaceae bacterium]
MNVLVIGGFLGAGKTSFIKAMTRATGRQFVVVENEFGNIDMDSRILKGENPDMKVWELTEGCICCSMNMDFSLSVMTIANTLNPDYLLVEPSGVALPSRIIESLRKISYENIGVLSPVTIVDAQHFRDQRRDYGEYFGDQVRAAGTVVLSKSENLNENEFAEIERELGLAGGVSFPRVHYSQWPKEEWLALLSRRLPGTEYVGGEGEAEPERPLMNLALRDVSFSSPVELIAKFELLLSGALGRVVRAKGFAPKVCGDEWLCFNVVGGTYEITSCAPMDSGEIVIIGEDLNLEMLTRLFGGTVVEEDEEDEEQRRGC